MPSRADWKWVDPKTLVRGKNKRNWKSHPVRQKKVVAALIERNGWARPLVWNSRSNRLVDGHCRLDVAIERGWKEVPVLYGDWTELQEAELLASLDTTGDMSKVDARSLDSLARDVAGQVESLVGKDSNVDEIMRMSIDLHGHAVTLDTDGPRLKRRGSRRKIANRKVKLPKGNTKAKQPNKVVLEQRAIEDSVIYRSSNPLGVPDLSSKTLWTDLDVLPTSTWDATPATHGNQVLYSWNLSPFRGKSDGGFLSFFTQDYRFSRLYRHSQAYVDKFLAWNFFAMIEPDFSTYEDWPYAARLWNVYKSRWTANYFFDKTDTKIIPLIRSSSNPDRDSWLYELLPDAPIMAINCAMRHANKGSKDKHAEIIAASIAKALSIRRKIRVVILYGGYEDFDKTKGYLPKGPKYHPIEAWTTARRRAIQAPK